MPALHPSRFLPVALVTTLSAVLLAACERSVPAANREAAPPRSDAPPAAEAVDSQEKTTVSVTGSPAPAEGRAARTESLESESSPSDNWSPPPAGSKLSPEEAHRMLTGAVQFNPGAIPSSGIRVQPDTPLEIGQDLQVQWNSTWWAATIVGFEADGRPRIHYYGWADSYDEVKDRSALQLDPDVRLRALDQSYVREGRRPAPIQVTAADVDETVSEVQSAVINAQPDPLFALAPGQALSAEDTSKLLGEAVLFNPQAIQSSDVPVQPHTPLNVGQELQVQWGNTWWAGTVRGFEPDGRVRVHYFGWSDSYDEVKSRAELQLDPHVRIRAINRMFPQ